jgi:putative hemin transport protein
MDNTMITTNSSSLRDSWSEIQRTNPGIRIREAAALLSVSEAELLATTVGEHIVKLQGPWPELLKRFASLGRVMSLTRNDSCILEHKGAFRKIDIIGQARHAMATVIGPIETRAFLSAWHVAFAATEEKNGRLLRSIQVFDQAGIAVTKIYLQESSDTRAFEAIIADFRAPHQDAPLSVIPYDDEVYDNNAETGNLLEDWAALKDTHDFFSMLRRHNVSRIDALRRAHGTFTAKVDPSTTPEVILRRAASEKLPIMIFAGNRGNLQIHQGKVRTIRMLERGHKGPERWLNVLDPDFNMHLKADDVCSAWIVRKPTTDGDVTSVELFDQSGSLIAQFFGLRKPGIPEREGWRILVNSLQTVVE